MYCAFLMLAFQQLIRAQGQVNGNFYWSLVWFCVAISVKSIAAIFGVAYIVFLCFGPSNLGWKEVLKSVTIVLASITILNPWLLYPKAAGLVLSRIYTQSEVTRLGWPELHYTWSFASSSTYFNNWYISIVLLLIITLMALVTSGFLWGKPVQGGAYRE